jgi:hypothetical protein
MGGNMDITTVCGEKFNYEDSCDMAFMIYRRFGREMEDAHIAWKRLLQNSCEFSQFEKMVLNGRSRYYKD